MKVIIPVAGYATRLYPLTKNQPKALIDVKGKPILEHIIHRVADLGNVDHVYLVTNTKFFQNFDLWAEKVNSKIPIKVVNDHTTSNDDRLGQVGDILYAIDEEQIDDDLLIIAGDNLFNFSLNPCYEFFMKKNQIVNALYDVLDKEEAKKLGIVKIDGDGRFLGFQEKPAQPESTLASIGVIFFPKNDVGMLKQYVNEGNNADKIGHFFEWLIKKQEVYGYVYKEKWFDIGSFESLGKARAEFRE